MDLLKEGKAGRKDEISFHGMCIGDCVANEDRFCDKRQEEIRKLCMKTTRT